jgi:Tol biopolymer transport system component/tRNA A-37 threonylcarbamoyl transferase component Bud32
VADVLERLKAALSDRYRIERELGRGGMATVYLAEDLKHHRKVAVKVLRPELAAILGADRFLNEIEVTAHLQHPHILPLFDSGEADGFLYYVMPHVEGESLLERLQREKQLPVDDALRITAEVASALDYAHRHDVIHRDIKPGNILLSEGQALVADFGIALAVTAAGGDRVTETGLSLGTPEYMSPEQATGDHAIDVRSDVYSLAAVLYEMLTGEAPHTGPTIQAIVSKILTEEAEPVTARRKALAKLPADRFTHAIAFSDALSDPTFTGPSLIAPTTRRRGQWTQLTMLLAVVSALLAACVVGMLGWHLTHRGEPPVVSRWKEGLPPGHQLDVGLLQHPLAISHDGKLVAYVSRSAEGSQLYVRKLNEYEAVAIPGTDGAGNPFFSPDGRWVGFFADGKIQKVALDGGSPVVICEVSAISAGADWGINDTILFATATEIFRVAATGGRPERLTQLDPGGLAQSRPQLLPDGKTVLFTVQRQDRRTTAALLSLSERRWEVIEGVGEAVGVRYVPSGYLLFVQGGALRVMRFEADRLETRGATMLVQDAVAGPTMGIAAFYDVSHTGVFVYVPASSAANRLVWVDRRGRVTQLPIEEASFARPVLSPDGSRLAVVRYSEHGWETWVYDADRGRGTRLSVADMTDDPCWAMDGEHVTFSFGSEWINLGWMRADGIGDLDTLVSGRNPQFPHSWSPDGTLAFYEITREQGRDIGVLRVPGEGSARPLIATPANERSPSFSPDGRWLAYVSDESGRDEIYVQPYPSLDTRHLVSTQGGRDPAWSRDGRELFFRNGDFMMVSEIPNAPSFSAGTPQVLFRGSFDAEPGTSGSHTYGVSPDGRFLMVQSEPLTELRVVLNWLAELEQGRQP